MFFFVVLFSVCLCLSVLRRASLVSSSAWSSSTSQVVPKFNKRFSVLPDQLMTKEDVPAGGEGTFNLCDDKVLCSFVAFAV